MVRKQNDEFGDKIQAGDHGSCGFLSFEDEESSGTIFRQVTVVPKFITDTVF